MKRFVLVVLILALIAPAVIADVKFTRLDDSHFIVYHRKLTGFGAEAKATTRLYEEVASICMAAGFSYFSIESMDIQERQFVTSWGRIWDSGRGLAHRPR